MTPAITSLAQQGLDRLEWPLLVPIAVMAAVRLVGERLWPAHPPRHARDGMNLLVFALWLAGQALLSPAVGGLATLAVNRMGGGLIVLPAHGWGLAIGVAVYLVAMDLAEYVFHRAQHAIPALWAMHSLHHSDRSFDSTTTVRHFWADPFLKAVSVWLAVGLVFRASPEIVGIYAAISFYNYLIHSNTRLDFGPMSWALNAPGYHRLHHSASPEHFDTNFAALLPIFDVLTGAYRPARPGERPQTGLDTGEEPAGPLQALAWPIRGLWRRDRAQKPAGPHAPAPDPAA